MAGLWDAYHGLWTSLFGPDHPTTPTTQYPLVVNADGSINVNTSGGITVAPLPPKGYPDIVTSQVTVTDVATLIAAADADRGEIMIVMEGVKKVWIGEAGVTTGTGVMLLGTVGSAMSIPTNVAVFGICLPGESALVSVIEVFNT